MPISSISNIPDSQSQLTDEKISPYADINESGINDPSEFNNHFAKQEILGVEELDDTLELATITKLLEEWIESGTPGVIENVEDRIKSNPELKERILTLLQTETSAKLLIEPEPNQIIGVVSNASKFVPKTLNDNLGTTKTDLLIKERHRQLASSATGLGTPISETFNSDVISIDADWQYGLEMQLRREFPNLSTSDFEQLYKNKVHDALANMLDGTGQGMTSYLWQIVTPLVTKEPSSGVLKIHTMLKAGDGFRFAMGVAQIDEPFSENPDDLLNKKEGNSKASCASRLAQINANNAKETRQKPEVEIFSVEEFKNNLDAISALREGLISQGNTLMLSDGVELKLFDSAKNSDGKILYRMNPNIIRAIRKNKLKSDDYETVQKVSEYLKRTNVIDSPMYYTASELFGEVRMRGGEDKKLAAHLRQVLEVADRLENDEPLKLKDWPVLKNALKKDPRDPVFSSRSEFHAKALEMQNKVYITVDVLDLGIDVVLDYEQILQKLQYEISGGNNLEMVLARYLLTAGDNITLKMRQFREDVQQTLIKEGIPADQIANFLGGDEETIVFDAKKFINKDGTFNDERLDQVLVKLRNSINARVIAVPSLGAPEDKQSLDNKLKHLRTMSALDVGTDISKNYEEMIRRLVSHYGVDEVQKFPLIKMFGFNNFSCKRDPQQNEWYLVNQYGEKFSLDFVSARLNEIDQTFAGGNPKRAFASH